jgi:hypothetical protein
MIFAQENAVDLHSVGRVPLRAATMVGGKHTGPGKNMSPSLHVFLSTGHHLLAVSLVTRLKSNSCTALTTQNSTKNNCIFSYIPNTTALQPNDFVT